jgi:hypothetical protein
MKRLINLLSILFMVSATLSIAFDALSISPPLGKLYVVTTNSTIQGMKDAAMGRSGTAILQKGDLVLFGWSIEDGWAFTIINTQNRLAHTKLADIYQKGYLTACKTFSCLVDTLQNNGWKIIAGKEIPNSIRWALTANTWLAALAKSNTTFLFMFPSAMPRLPGTITDAEEIIL